MVDFPTVRPRSGPVVFGVSVIMRSTTTAGAPQQEMSINAIWFYVSNYPKYINV